MTIPGRRDEVSEDKWRIPAPLTSENMGNAENSAKQRRTSGTNESNDTGEITRQRRHMVPTTVPPQQFYPNHRDGYGVWFLMNGFEHNTFREIVRMVFYRSPEYWYAQLVGPAILSALLS